MSEAFLKIVNMSISASWLVLAVLVLRLLWKKAPKWALVLLWGIVAVRLVCPFSIESALSLIPSRETIRPEIMTDWTPEISTGIEPLDQIVNPIISSAFAPEPISSANPLQILIPVSANFWILGMAVMLLHTVVSYFRLRKKVDTAVRLRDNIYQSEKVDSPFVLGIRKPRVYLPFSLEEPEMGHVIAHEMTHIRRKDHWWKPLGFLLLTVHWFNPLMWAAYILLCRDIELACDEKVISELGYEQRADYTQALLECSVNRRLIAACPLAFGEVGVKERVKNVMHYKKPGFWIILIAVMVCIVVAVCFLTDPPMPSLEVLPLVHSHSYGTVEVTYESATLGLNEMVDSRFRITENMELGIKYGNVSYTGWIELGTLTETTLTRDNFDDICDSGNGWLRGESAARIRKNAAHVWQLVREDLERFYYLIQVKNGELFLAAGYYDTAEKNDPGSDDTAISVVYRIGVELNEEYNIVAKSGENVASMTIFPAGTPIANYAKAVHWLTIDSGEDLCPFRVYQNGEEVIGHYICYDTETYEPVPYLIPSGLDPQTYLFQNCDPNREYIVVMMRSTEQDAEILCFGVRFSAEPSRMDNLEYYLTIGDEGVCKIVVSAEGEEEVICKENGMPYQKGDRLLMNLLTGNALLEGVGIRAFDADGKRIWDVGIYGRGWGSAEEEIAFDDWLITPVLRQEENHVLQAQIMEIREGSFLVKPLPGSWELSSADLIEVPMENMYPSPEPQVGDILRIEYDGQLMETYPARIGTVYHISVAEMVQRMINMSGIIFIDTGEAIPVEIDPSAILGTLHTQVEGRPKNHGQGNFDCVGCQYAWLERENASMAMDLAVLIDNEWYRFTEEVLTSPEYYLTIGKEGAVFIEVTSGSRTELICHEDQSAYECGESVLLPVLTGKENLRGVTITVRDADNYDIFSVSISAKEHGTADDVIECGDWIITPVGE